MAKYFIRKYERANAFYSRENGVQYYVLDENYIYTYDDSTKSWNTDEEVQSSNTGGLPEAATKNDLHADGDYDIANVSSDYTTITLDDSVNSDDLLKYLGEYSGDLPLETVDNKSAQFVGWSTSNTDTVTPATSTTDVSSSSLTSLSFSDLTEDPTPEVPSVFNDFYAILKYFDTFDHYDEFSTDKYDVDGDGTLSEAEAANVVAQAEENKLVNNALTKLPEPYISGLKLGADIELNGLTLNTIDENNVLWVLSDIDGWWTLPDPELPDLPRGWGDGSYDAIGRYAARVINLSGSFIPQQPEDAAAARAKLIQAISLVKTGGWLKVNESPTKAAYVRLSGRPQILNVNRRGRHDFTIGLVAADPIKYEWVGNTDGYDLKTLTVDTPILDNAVPTGYYSGTVDITTTGDVAVPIVIELPFGLTIPDENALPYIENGTTDQRITINTGTESTSKLELDTYNREVLEVTYDTYSISNAVGDGANTVYTTSEAFSGVSVGSLVSIVGVNPPEHDIRNAEVISVDSANNKFTVASSETASYVSGGDLLVTYGVENARSKANVLIGWIYLNPGLNEMFAANFPENTEITILYNSGWLG